MPLKKNNVACIDFCESGGVCQNIHAPPPNGALNADEQDNDDQFGDIDHCTDSRGTEGIRNAHVDVRVIV